MKTRIRKQNICKARLEQRVCQNSANTPNFRFYGIHPRFHHNGLVKGTMNLKLNCQLHSIQFNIIKHTTRPWYLSIKLSAIFRHHNSKNLFILEETSWTRCTYYSNLFISDWLHAFLTSHKDDAVDVCQVIPKGQSYSTAWEN